MKYCEEYAALLDAYFDGECTPGEADRVRAHIAVCPGCRAYLNELALLRDAFPDAEDTEVPEGFADGVMAAIRADAAPQKRPSRWKRLVPVAACLAVVVLAANQLPGRMGGGSSGSTMAAAPAAAAGDAAGAAAEPRSGETYQYFTAASEAGSQNDAAESAPQTEKKAAGKQSAAAEDAAPAESPAVADPEDAPAAGVTVMTSGASEEVWLAELTVTAAEAEGLTENWTPLDSGADGDRYTLTEAQLEELLARLGDVSCTPGEGELALVTVVP